ncbi:MAG: hypothetical protein DRI57_18440 [Deltaproteobacteria bacterium]|nr:MAG: hypothetical protein DRI57_18440 [Deltaproteobacteria bacterium]
MQIVQKKRFEKEYQVAELLPRWPDQGEEARSCGIGKSRRARIWQSEPSREQGGRSGLGKKPAPAGLVNPAGFGFGNPNRAGAGLGKRQINNLQNCFT